MWQGSYEFIVNQWGVGHGGFHSQSLVFQELDRNPSPPELVGDGTTIRVVYDCGSGRTKDPRPELEAAIGRMLDEVANGSTIDLLVISHFDQDHVNGLGDLAAALDQKGISVARVWAPVLTKIEALVAITTSGLTGNAQQAYAALVVDPVSRLTELFQGAEVTTITPDNDPIPLVPSGADADVGGRDIVLTAAPRGGGLVANAGPAPAGEALWEFQPYVVESTLVGSKAVSALAHKLLGKPADQCSLTDLIALANDATLRKEFHAAVHQHHKQLKRVIRASSARTGANLSSLCVYSGPVAPYDWCHFRGGWDPVDVSMRAIPIAPAWLGTGDAGLLKPQHVDALRTALTQSRMDRVGVSSAPHHGSKGDSGAPLWDAMPNARWVTIEADNLQGGTGHHHPHGQVLDELSVRNLTTSTVIGNSDFWWRDKRLR